MPITYPHQKKFLLFKSFYFCERISKREFIIILIIFFLPHTLYNIKKGMLKYIALYKLL
jgi:hypothetical protein